MATYPNKFRNLYSRHKDGRPVFWNVSVIREDDFTATIFVEYGLLGDDYKSTIKTTRIKSGKNIGKANETTAYEQASLEAQSKWNKKKRSGYKTHEDVGIKFVSSPRNLANYEYKGVQYTLEAALEKALPTMATDKDGFIKPMLAQKFYKKLKRGKVPVPSFPCLGQPKINGVRATLAWDDKEDRAIFRSREGLEYKLPHITDHLTIDDFYYTLNEGDDLRLVYDGELYIDGEILSEVVSAVKKPNLKTTSIYYLCFDLAIPNVIQNERLVILEFMLLEMNIHALIVAVDTLNINSEKQAIQQTTTWIEDGHEGGIFRTMDGLYGFGKRPKDLSKLKFTESKEFEIVGVRDSDHDPGHAILICKNDMNNETFDVIPKGTREYRASLFNQADELIGKMMTVEFYERTKNDIPFHTVGIAIRDYE